jgi:hypothetical protein
MTDELWKPVPLEFTFGVENVYASNLGRVKIKDSLIIPNKGPKGRCGFYKVLALNRRSAYFHRLVFYAHSDLPISEKQNGRVIFRNGDDITDECGYYKCRFQDLLFEPSKINFNVLAATIREKDAEHPCYGAFKFGVWLPLCTLAKAEKTVTPSSIYEICLLDNPKYPCVVRNKVRNQFVKYHFHKDLDGYVSLNHNKKNINYQLTHIMLASTFPTTTPLASADHIDDDSNNHCILNLQWLSLTDNSKKGQAALPTKEKIEEPALLDGEEWRPLPINDYTKERYQVSNFARIKKMHSISRGSPIRGRKYRQTSVAVAVNTYTKYYMHQLVYITFLGSIPENMIILHDDTAPLLDGRYRNWFCDLRLGSKKENNKEHHLAKRTPTSIKKT